MTVKSDSFNYLFIVSMNFCSINIAHNSAPKSHPIIIIFFDYFASYKISITMSQTVELKVGMSCQGCVGAVKRVLGKLDGVESFDIDIEKQKVTVKGPVQPDVVFQTVSKTGKATAFWEAPAPEAPAVNAPAPVAPAAEPEIKPTETVAAA